MGFGMHYFYHKHGSIRNTMIIYFWPVTYAMESYQSGISF